ncbi:MAG: PAS domain S-box protein, partial [Sphingobacteriales bacterium]
LPIVTQNNAPLFLVLFEEITKKSLQKNSEDVIEVSVDDQAEHELLAAKEHLQAVIEELSASNMEMQALTEEIQSTNEELQASNEELEATNQELQATNEELFSVNEESLKKSDALSAINVDFEGVYNTLEFPVLVFDAKLRVKRVNIAAIKMFHLSNVNGRHISELSLPPYFSSVEENTLEAFKSANKLAFSINHEEKSFQVYATPTLDANSVAQGVVLLIVDNTSLISITKKQRETQDNLLSIMNNSVSMTALKDITGRYEFVNNRFLELSGLSNQQILGRTDFQLFDQKLAHQLRAGDLQVMSKLESISSVEEMHFNGKSVWLSTVRFPIWDHDGGIKSICLQATDISHVKIAEEQLRLAAKVFDRSG